MRVILLILLSLSISCSNKNQQTVKNAAPAVEKAPIASNVTAENSRPINLNGNYESAFDFQGGNYKVTYFFSGEKYNSELFFEDEQVSKCEGAFSVKGSKLIKTKRVYTFLRAENPSGPTQKEDLEQNMRNVTDSTFELQLIKASEEGFADSIWVILKKKK